MRPPILLATLAVILSFLPMLFITGMMGPYMRPMAVNVPLAMVMSMVVEFTITRWLAHLALRGGALADGNRAPDNDAEQGDPGTHFARLLGPLLDDRRKGTALLAAMALLFAGAVLLGALRSVPLKMLPFDNKNEFQVLIDADEGTTLERIDATARALARVLRQAPEVRDFQDLLRETTSLTTL